MPRVAASENGHEQWEVSNDRRKGGRWCLIRVGLAVPLAAGGLELYDAELERGQGASHLANLRPLVEPYLERPPRCQGVVDLVLGRTLVQERKAYHVPDCGLAEFLQASLGETSC